MRKTILVIWGVLVISFADGQTILESAKKTAKDKHQLILLIFSGSDWCIPCIKMDKGIFENDGFKKMSDSLLTIVKADFPRNKKNMQDMTTRKQNEALADEYNPNGAFPYTLLLDADGKVIRAWEGLPRENADSFISEIRAICANYK